eukprot:TRINITY_DN5588_c0_g1_i1.p1 TRINITY_DN5588_c0_g1~~TRINITY_DN5588_c0_g1_i1.p1  ORF type:complete len:147 (-),score=45.53 TRINITY_DN5588_c0_g1_i1:83-523(-)
MFLAGDKLRAAFFMTKTTKAPLTHKQLVTRQYKKVLVTLKDHAGIYRNQWYDSVGRARDAFEEHRHINDARQQEYLLSVGDKWLDENKHYAPYTLPYMEGGTKWQRNLEYPEHMKADDRNIDFEAEMQMDHWDAMEGPQSNWRSDF